MIGLIDSAILSRTKIKDGLNTCYTRGMKRLSHLVIINLTPRDRWVTLC